MNNSFTVSFRNRTVRERLFIVITTMVFIFLIFILGFYAPFSHQIKSTAEKIKAAQKSVLTLSELHNNYQLIIRSPTNATDEKIQSLEKKLVQLQAHPLLVKKLIRTPEDLKNALRDISKMRSTMSLSQIQTLATVPIETPNESKMNPLFSQRISIEFTGSYLDTIHYLNYLENLSWYLSFVSIEYQVENYPKAKVTLVLNLLSTEKGA